MSDMIITARYENDHLVVAYRISPMEPFSYANLRSDLTLGFDNSDELQGIRDQVTQWVMHELPDKGLDGEHGRLRYKKGIKSLAWNCGMKIAAKRATKRAEKAVLEYLTKGVNARILCAGCEMTHYVVYITHD